ncbi:MAG: HAMP domain-containing protein [Desulfobacteraceae bacterium]|nr:HAMP domain-containing protein [Desulfobacteraceae bacterium]
MWIIHSEEKDRINSANESLILVSSRYKEALEKTIDKKRKQGLTANQIVLESLTRENNTLQSIIIKDREGAFRSSDGLSGAFFSNLNELTSEQKKLFAITENLWKDIAPLLLEDFYNFYFISDQNFIRIFPKDWAMEIEADHNFLTDIFYSVAAPEKNPSKKPVWTEVYYDSIWKKWMTSLIVPLYNNDLFLGVTGSDFILDDIFNHIEQMAKTEGWCKGFLFDNNGNIIVHADYKDEILKKQNIMNEKLSFENVNNEGLTKLISKINNKKQALGTPFTFYDRKNLSYVVVQPIKFLNWNLGIYSSHSSVTKGLPSLRGQILIVSISLAVFLALILKYSFSRLILQRINRLGDGVFAISAGDHDFNLDVVSKDEVGTLEQGFLDMRDSVKDKITELENKNEELQQFAYVASHDLQEPLRMVSSYVQLLAKRYKGKLDEDADDFIDFAVDGANRMHALINDLLTYSRVGSKGNPFKLISTKDIIKEVFDNLSVTIEESNTEITCNELPSIVADKIQFIQLFQNLLANAIKFKGKEAPKINIKAEETDEAWSFSVQDNGIGMASEFTDRIFVIFQRLHNRTEYPGTGIGLSVCKKIVERHGGRIWVESKQDVGSTFYFIIPKREET